MLTFKIEPIEFKTVSGASAVVTGLAPQKKECLLVGAVETATGKVSMVWSLTGEAEREDSEAFNLVNSAEVRLKEIAYFSKQLCPG